MIEIEKIQYKTIDGEIFDDFEEASKHELSVCKLKCYNEDRMQIPIDSIESAIYLNIPDDEALEQFKVLSDLYSCATNGVLSPGKYMWTENRYYLIDYLIKGHKNEIKRLTKLKEKL